MHPLHRCLVLAVASSVCLAADAPWKQSTLVAYNGDSTKGGGWSGQNGTCSWERSTTVFRKAPGGAVWHVDIPGQFINGGWNWHQWFPKGKGTDLGTSKTLRFAVKMDGPAKPQGLKLSLASAVGSGSGKLELTSYCPKAFDGEWHEVIVPLKDLAQGNPAFDTRTVWELDFETWSATALKFDLYVDEIGFDR